MDIPHRIGGRGELRGVTPNEISFHSSTSHPLPSSNLLHVKVNDPSSTPSGTLLILFHSYQSYIFAQLLEGITYLPSYPGVIIRGSIHSRVRRHGASPMPSNRVLGSEWR